MTTQIQERMRTGPLPAASHDLRGKAPRGGRKRSSFVSWLIFLIGIVACAIVIGVIAAALGRAAMAVTDARGILEGLQADASDAQVAYTNAVADEQAASDAIEQRKQEIVEQLQSEQQGASFEMLDESGPAFAEIDRMQADLARNQTAAREAAQQRLDAAQAAVAGGESELAAAEAQVEATLPTLWIASIASGVVLLALLLVAVLRTRAARRGT